VPLGQDLIDAATLADLVFYLFVLGTLVRGDRFPAHRCAAGVKLLDDGFLLQINGLVVVFAVE